jgi:glycosyltransferase involved in cell wall biosynthesis
MDADRDRLVSVVIPCFNQGRFLEDAIRSVERQRYSPIEIIVVNDGSTDSTSQVAGNHDVALITQPNRGISAARNAGLNRASGEYVVFLDADDELLPDAVSSGVAFLVSRPEFSCVVRRCQPTDVRQPSVTEPLPVLNEADLYREWLLHNFVWTPGAAMFRRKAIGAIGGFQTRFNAASDYGVYLALARSHSVALDPRDAVRYRQHGANMSLDPALMLRSVLTVLRHERSRLPDGYRVPFEIGRRSWKRHYGEQIVERLRREWRVGRASRWQVRAVATLFGHCGDVVITHAVRKLSRIVRGVPPEEIELSRWPSARDADASTAGRPRASV